MLINTLFAFTLLGALSFMVAIPLAALGLGSAAFGCFLGGLLLCGLVTFVASFL